MQPHHRIPSIGALSCLLLVALPPAARGDDGHDHGHEGFTHPVTTESPEAQKLFDRGLQLAWGFNHKEAARVFDQAVEKDPKCGMCWWGKALVLGPNINAPLAAPDYPAILEALAKTRELRDGVTPREQAYIDALGQRYGAEYEEERTALDKAYADAMRRVAYREPSDLTAATLFAEALMDTSPWDYWLPNGEPKAATEEFIRVLETVLRRDAAHPGAAHLLIHAVEKARPELGVPAAEMLDRSEQATGHLVHMASHIYMRVGRWDDSARVNQRAIDDDDAYAAENEVPFEYIPYMLHNHHMRWASLGFDGRRADALAEANYLRDNLPPAEMLTSGEMIPLQHFWAVPLFDAVWFEDFDAVLAMPEPPEGFLYGAAVWHWARGTAQARKGDTEAAATALAALREGLQDPALDDVNWGNNSLRSILEIARENLEGEIAVARGEVQKAIRNLEEAARREDALVYTEPPVWLGPTRQRLAEVQLDHGSFDDAAQTVRANLDVYPHNGRSLAILAECLEAQGKEDDAAEIRFLLDAAWQRADIELD
ncbi:MAG: tetratricopeptide repeat protein [Acidobacteriota bacterium]